MKNKTTATVTMAMDVLESVRKKNNRFKIQTAR